MRIAVAGTGYVGLVTGVCLASKGHQVTCVDVDEEKIKKLKCGIVPIYESGLEELLNESKDNIQFTMDYKKAYRNAEVIFIGVGTPEKKDGSANLSYVYKVAEQIAETIENDCVVVVKSTVPIGTNDKLEQFIKNHLLYNVHVDVASNPEFLAQGTAVKDTLHASRIVLGIERESAKAVLTEVYKDFNVPVVVTDRKSAEMIKYASNNFLALKVSYINEIANLCEKIGANIEDVSKGMGYDSRIGNKFLRSGIGYGGSCFPKDTKALNWLANYNDNELKTIKAAIEVNENQKLRLIKKARKYYSDFYQLKIAVLGLTFKPGTDDLREAPSLVNIPILLEDGANIKAWDPVGEKNFKKFYPDEIIYCDTIEDTLENADLCFIFTEWDAIKMMEVDIFERCMHRPIVIDGRNCFALDQFKETHILYDSIGRPVVDYLYLDNTEENRGVL